MRPLCLRYDGQLEFGITAVGNALPLFRDPQAFEDAFLTSKGDDYGTSLSPAVKLREDHLCGQGPMLTAG